MSGNHRRLTPLPHTTTQPYKEWPLRARVIERAYRLLHRGQIRTLVVRHEGSWDNYRDGDTSTMRIIP